jgi:hypothetical protein
MMWLGIVLHVGVIHVAGPLAWLAASAYWVYVVHLPLTEIFGALLFGLPIPAVAEWEAAGADTGRADGFFVGWR